MEICNKIPHAGLERGSNPDQLKNVAQASSPRNRPTVTLEATKQSLQQEINESAPWVFEALGHGQLPFPACQHGGACTVPEHDCGNDNKNHPQRNPIDKPDKVKAAELGGHSEHQKSTMGEMNRGKGFRPKFLQVASSLGSLSTSHMGMKTKPPKALANKANVGDTRRHVGQDGMEDVLETSKMTEEELAEACEAFFERRSR